MVKQSAERLTGNAEFEGFAIDLIQEIAEILSKDNLVNMDERCRGDGTTLNFCF